MAELHGYEEYYVVDPEKNLGYKVYYNQNGYLEVDTTPTRANEQTIVEGKVIIDGKRLSVVEGNVEFIVEGKVRKRLLEYGRLIIEEEEIGQVEKKCCENCYEKIFGGQRSERPSERESEDNHKSDLTAPESSHLL